jgi:hypothetical protein
VAQRDEVAGFLGGHDAGDAGDAQHVAFFGVAGFDEGQGGGQHFDAAAGDGDAVRGGLGGHVHHVGLALGVKVGEPVIGEYVQGIWQPLMAAARARGELSPELDERFAWEVLLGRDRTVNAFALPGATWGCTWA